jgi:hypothetical protein
MAERNAAEAAAGAPFDELFFPYLPFRPSTAAGRLGKTNYERQPTASPAMITNLIGSNNLARKVSVGLARAPGPRSTAQKKKQIAMADLIQMRVNSRMVPKVEEENDRLQSHPFYDEGEIPPRIDIHSVWNYAESRDTATGLDLDHFRARGATPWYIERPGFPVQYSPVHFPTVVQPLPPFTEARCSPITTEQLRQQLDELQKLLKEKNAMLFNLKRINYASIDHENMAQATVWDRQFQEEPKNWVEHLRTAQRKSEQAMFVLRDQQIPELRERIDRLTEEITRRKKGKTCNLLGGSKTKSKHTKSKKSKIRKRRSYKKSSYRRQR